MEIIKHSERVHVPSFYYQYERKDGSGSGYMFPCDPNGNLTMSDIGPIALESLEFCRNDAGTTLDDLGVIDCSHDYTEHGIGRCYCGKEVELYGNTNECECGLLYNMGGQDLAPREQWERDW